MLTLTLRDISEIITKGTTPTTVGYAFLDSGINFIKVESIDEEGNFVAAKIAKISQECNEKLKRSQLKKDDILISIAGVIGRIALVNDKVLPANINQALALVRIKDKRLNLRYLKKILQSEYVTKQYEIQKQGVAQINLSLKNVGDIVVPVPSIDEQQRIADELDMVSGLIEKRQKQLEKLDLLIKSRFVEMFGNPIRNLKKMRLVKLSELGVWSSGGTPPRNIEKYFMGNIDWYSAGELKELFLTGSIEKITLEALENSSAKLFPPGSMLIGMYDTAAFKMGILQKESSSNQACACIIPNNKISIIWLYYILQEMKPYFLLNRRGIRQKNLNLGMIKNFEIPLSEREMQNQFADFVEKVEQNKSKIKNSLDKLITLKKALMQKYFG